MSITSRATKAQIIEYAQSLEDRIALGPTWPQITTKLGQVIAAAVAESKLAVLDAYRTGVAVRRWCDIVWMELSRPILK